MKDNTYAFKSTYGFYYAPYTQKVEAENGISIIDGENAILRIPLQFGNNFGLNPSSR